MAPFHPGGFDSNGNGKIDMHESYMHMQVMNDHSSSGGGLKSVVRSRIEYLTKYQLFFHVFRQL